MTHEQKVSQFLQFLEERDLLVKYILRCIEQKGKHWRGLNFGEFSTFVTLAFDWEDTKEGFPFWRKVALDWYIAR